MARSYTYKKRGGDKFAQMVNDQCYGQTDPIITAMVGLDFEKDDFTVLESWCKWQCWRLEWSLKSRLPKDTSSDLDICREIQPYSIAEDVNPTR